MACAKGPGGLLQLTLRCTQVRKMSVGEAVMQLDLMEAPALVFHNAAHGGLNVVYRRADGNIGWIDPNMDLTQR